MNEGFGTVIVLSLIRFYQRFLSPFLIPACRFTPSCSAYTYDAVSKYGAMKGAYLGIKRILRCNPFCKGGFDPVR